MNRSQKIRAVLFDFGGTLDSDGINWKDRFYPLYRKAGLKWNREKFDERFYAADDFLSEKTLKTSSYFDTLYMQVSLVLKENDNVKKNLALKITESFLDDSMKIIIRNTRILKRLGEQYTLGIISNFYGNLPVICKEVGLSRFLKVIVDSNVVGYSKPDPRIFFCALDGLKVKPGETVFIGDSPSRDMQGAKSVGMKHIWLKSNHYKTGQPCCKGDRMIQSLLELESVLSVD